MVSEPRPSRLGTGTQPRLDDIDLLLFDFDGVLTDNRVQVSADGIETVTCNRSDGWGVDLLRAAKLKMAIVSTETNAVVRVRAEKLRLPVLQGVKDKSETVRSYAQEQGVTLERVGFVGNDTNDLPALKIVGWPMCPIDSAVEVRALARWIVAAKGGDGVIRMLTDTLLQADSEPSQAVPGSSPYKTTTKPLEANLDIEKFYVADFTEHLQVAEQTRNKLQLAFTGLLAACVKCVRNEGKILFFGNGGSAGDSQHLATELTIRYKRNRAAIAAIALTTDTSALTACGNDFGFDQLFSRQIEALGKPGDVAFGISTSGKSPNILLAMKQARSMGLVTAALSGRGGGDLGPLTDHLLVVPSETTARIQEMHITLGQMLCGALEIELGLAQVD